MVPNILVIEASFYPNVSRLLMEGAVASLKKAGAEYDCVTVPGALEIPTAINFAVKGGGRGGRSYDGFVALGCVIKGETYHFDIVATQSARAITDLGVNYGLCIGNGILTVYNEEQALVRADPAQQNKGGSAVDACLSLIDLRYRMGARRDR